MRLIDADALIEEIQSVYVEEKSEDPKWAIGLRYSKHIVRNMPTVDAVRIVECKDCIKHETYDCPLRLEGMHPEDDFYCKQGKRTGV